MIGTTEDMPPPEPKIRLRSLEAELQVPDQPIPWVWSQRLLVAEGRPCIVGGYGGTAKTWLALAMGLSVATGCPCLGEPPSRIGRVVHLSYEASDRATRRRLRKLVRGLGLADLGNYSFATQGDLDLWLTSPEAEGELVAMCQGVTLLTIDSLAVGAQGLDENAPQMAGPLHMLGRISAKTGCAIVVIAHTRKSGPHKSNIAETLRGSSAIHAAIDAAWILTREDGSEVSEVRPGKWTEASHCPQGWALEVVDTDDGGIILAAKDLPNEGELSEGRAAASNAALERSVLAYVTDHPGQSGRAVKAHVTGNDARIGKALTRLVAAGRLLEKPGRKGADLYFPVGDGDLP